MKLWDVRTPGVCKLTRKLDGYIYFPVRAHTHSHTHTHNTHTVSTVAAMCVCSCAWMSTRTPRTC